MTLKLIDSGDGQQTYDSSKWAGGSGTRSWVSAPSGQSGTWFQLSNGPQRRFQDVSYTGDTPILGFRTELPSSGPTNSPLAIFGYWNGSANVQHLYIDITPTGFRLLDGASNGSVLTTGGTPFTYGSGVRYIEIKVKVHSSTGTVEIREDEVVLWSATGVDTQQGATAIANSCSILSATASNVTTNWKFRDVYICGTDGSANNNFLGVFKTGVKTVSGAGNSAQFTANGAATPRECVDDGTTVDNDTTYASSATAGQQDTHALTSSGLTSGAVIRGTQTNIVMRKDDVDPRSGAAVIRSGSTDYPQTTLSLGTSYVLDRLIQEVDPNTSSAWLQTNLDAAELGYKVIS